MSNASGVMPCLLFPPISWWRVARSVQGPLRINTGAPLRNLGYWNRYRIAAANGPLLLSVPVIGGRRHDGPLTEIGSDDRQGWQRRQWRSLFSAYGRAPFFEYYGPELEALIMQRGLSLAARNLAAIRWLAKSMRVPLELEELSTVPEAARAGYEALAFGPDPELRRYHQVFEDRHGFIANLSTIDLLMMQGPGAGSRLVD